MTRTLLVDLGGTRLKAALQLPDGGISSEVAVVTHRGDWLPAVRAEVSRTGADEIALCVPGLVCDGRVVHLPGKLPGIEHVDLAGLLGVRLPLVVNDAVAYGVGEATCGAGRDAERVVVVTLGTGVGVAVVEDGQPLGRGPLGGGLLGGQLPLGGAGGGPDSSSRTGTFEARCSAAALAASVPGASGVTSAYALVRSADVAALQGFSDYRSWLVRGLVSLCLAHAPSCVVVGGGAAQPELLDGVQDAVAAELWPGQTVEVRLASLGDAAALAGLSVLLRSRVAA